MKANVAAALGAAAGLIVGFVGGQQHTAYRIASAFQGMADAFAPHSSPSASATFPNADVAKPRADLESLQIVSAHVDARPNLIMSAQLVVTVKNSSGATFERIDFDCAVKSPGRPVAWAECGRMYGSIPGGLAPGETKDIAASGLGATTVQSALKEHTEAALTVTIIDGKSVK